MDHADPAPDARAHVPRFGYRGRALTLLGLVWLLIGLDVLRDPSRTPILSDLLPPWVRVALWTAAGVVALTTAWWPTGVDRWGFMALTVPASLRVAVYGWSSVLGALVGGHVGDTSDWIGAVAWSAVVALILLLAGWAEPVQLNNHDDRERP